MHGWMYVRMDGRYCHGYKTKISSIDGLPYFLNNGALHPRTLPIIFIIIIIVSSGSIGVVHTWLGVAKRISDKRELGWHAQTME